MLKRWIIIGLLALLVGVQAGAAQEATVSPALEQQLTNLEQITETLRHLPAKQSVEHRFPTRDETIAYLQSTYDREFPQAQFDKLQRFYVALGLLPADINLHDVYLSLLDSQVAGFYDPDTKTMNVVPMVGDTVGVSLTFTEQVTYVHEFTHALQDQYFDLNSLTNTPEVQDTPDRSLAVTSLIEGDATAVMTLYAQQAALRNPAAALGMLAEGFASGNLGLPSGVPKILLDELLFPYTDGLNFVLALSNHGGWDAINTAFGDPPTTSEQILHPDKYLAGEGAQDVALDDQAAALGDGWSDAWDSALGEFYLREYLGTELGSSQADSAAAGWGGDHYRVYQNGDQLAFALRIVWDTPQEQSEFEGAYGQFGGQQFGGSADADGCWQNSSAALCLITGDAGDLIVSAPTLAQAKALAG